MVYVKMVNQNDREGRLLVSPQGAQTHNSLLEYTYKDLFKVLVFQQNTALLKCQF